jgi:hypothetical protein
LEAVADLTSSRPWWTLLALAALLLLSPSASARDEADPWKADVAFLLDELPEKARDLLRLKGIDWAKATRDLGREARKIREAGDYVRLVNRILARLEDGHAGIVRMAPELEAAWKQAMEDEAKGRRWTGPRVHLLFVGDDLYVGEAFGEAAQSGVKVGMSVLEIDGDPAAEWVARRVVERADTEGHSTAHGARYAACHWGLADWEGTPVSFTLREGRDTRKVTITRRGGPNYAPSGPIHPPGGLQQVGRQSYGKTAGGFGYVHLRDVPDDLPRQLDEILAALGDVPGLVLDLRANGGGGCDHEAVFGRFLAAGRRWRQYTGQGRAPYTGPMVVIVDAGVRSAGETVAGMFKEDGRAYVIGPEPTSGTSSQKEVIEVPSGLLSVRVSVASNKGRFNEGRGIEGIGVPPSEVVPYDPDELLAGVDTQIRRAEELLRDGFPKGAVPYDPAAE